MSSITSEKLLVRVLQGGKVSRSPVWLMRQAGRYLTEYQQIKKEHTFLEMCRSPELAFKVSMQPIDILDVDAAIVFADILLPLEGMGISIDFNPGPQIKNPITSAEDVNLLIVKPGDAAKYVSSTISMLRRELDSKNKAVLGFSAAPWTLACYLIEQRQFKSFSGTQVFAKQRPAAFVELMEKLVSVTVEYLIAQIEGGAEAVQIFDSWAGTLAREDYLKHALPYAVKVVEQLKSTGCPVIYYAGGCAHNLDLLGQIGADCVSVDWRVPLDKAFRVCGNDVVIQGNLDPTDLFYSAEEVRKRTRAMIKSVPNKSKYIVNLGHGILPESPRESVIALVEEAKQG